MDLETIERKDQFDWKKSFEYVTQFDWIFSSFWEKALLILLFINGVYSLIRLILWLL